jgi:hypothetical protein
MRLAWPVILQWRRETAKHSNVTVKVEGPNGLGFGQCIRLISRDKLDAALRPLLG